MSKKIYRAAYGESMNLNGNTISDIIKGEQFIEFTTVVIKLPGPTRNRVMYPLDEMKKAVASPMIQDLLNRGALYGEAGHPLDPKDINRWVVYPMDKVQFRWTKLWFEGDTLMGRVKTFPGNKNLLAQAILGGELPAFSIRVIGSESMENGYRTLRDIMLITIDWVNYPGNPNSYVPSSKDFDLSGIPMLSNDYYADGRFVPRGEATGIFNLNDNEELINLGEGYYTTVERMSTDNRKKLSSLRINSF